MTPIKPPGVFRESNVELPDETGKLRPVVVGLEARPQGDVVTFRLKGKRRAEEIPVVEGFSQAAGNPRTEIREPVFRISDFYVRDGREVRRVVVGIERGDVLTFRLDGTKSVYSLPISIGFNRAAMLEAERIRAERKAARKSRR
jgi:hypothetical protein